MIYYTISSKTNHWLRRVKKIEDTINQVLIYKKDLKFLSSINYYSEMGYRSGDKWVVVGCL